MIRQYDLVEKVKAYDPHADESLLNRAYVFSMRAHGTQTRASGDPYFSHPLEVAGILSDMKMDCATIITALLHDTVEDTIATIPEIEELFGKDIALLVDGVTKLSQLDIQTESSRQAENFRKFLLAMSHDIRVLLVKLADRLHNMQTLHYIKKPEKRMRIAKETMEIYAPLAERIGIRTMKDQLEDISFRELNPDAYQSITTRLDQMRRDGAADNRGTVAQIKNLLRKEGVEAQVEGREKTPYSIWSKMERQHITFEQLADVVAFRVIVDDEADCYRALGILHGKWAMVPGRFKDYISLPKRNGYQSIHTTVMGPKKHRIEIQIRTAKQHDVAEQGVAAHWQYKQDEKKTGSQYRWVRDFLEILDQASTPEEFLEHTKLEMFNDKVFCFTPKGELVPLPRGSSPVDFAYAVHTDVGDTCVGAKVNGRHVQLRHQLQNGDHVEILRSKAQTPSPRWENYVVTGKARAAIRRYVRNKEREEYQALGRTIIEKGFQRNKLDYSDRALEEGLPQLRFKTLDEMFFEVGKGLLKPDEVLSAAFPGINIKHDKTQVPDAVSDWTGEETENGNAIPIQGLTHGVAVHLAECCHPLPGDRIVGVMAPGVGVTVHTIDCARLLDSGDDPDEWLDLSWHSSKDTPNFFTGRLHMVMANETGVLAEITSVVARYGGNISNLRIAGRDPQFFTFDVDVEVRNVKHLTGIITALRSLKVISVAERVRG